MVNKKDNVKDRVNKVLEGIKPAIYAHGGDVELVDIKDLVVKVKLKGACAGCKMADYTLKLGIERKLLEKIPEIKGVEQVE